MKLLESLLKPSTAFILRNNAVILCDGMNGGWEVTSPKGYHTTFNYHKEYLINMAGMKCYDIMYAVYVSEFSIEQIKQLGDYSYMRRYCKYNMLWER